MILAHLVGFHDFSLDFAHASSFCVYLAWKHWEFGSWKFSYLWFFLICFKTCPWQSKAIVKGYLCSWKLQLSAFPADLLLSKCFTVKVASEINSEQPHDLTMARKT